MKIKKIIHNVDLRHYDEKMGGGGGVRRVTCFK